jgi:hypothetical protein
MPSEPRSPRLAVLIDADNASAKIVDGLFEEIAKIGEASVRRIYGDFSNPHAGGRILHIYPNATMGHLFACRPCR